MEIPHKELRLTLHKATTRGGGEHGWLSARHSFSFANWYEPTRMGFGKLLVLNDDVIAEGSGFGTHSHDNMEIITIITQGVLEHKDSMGSVGTISPGEVQVMSAGTGIWHSEYNGGKGSVKSFQIWIAPHTQNVEPQYGQRAYTEAPHGETLLVAPVGHAEVLTIHQDAFISKIAVDAEYPQTYILKKEGNGVYFFVIEGEVEIAQILLSSRDALGIEHFSNIPITTTTKASVLAIEVPMK